MGFFCGVVGMAVLIHAKHPMSYVPEVSEKLAALADRNSAVDTVFIGSSRVRRQISPALFDERMNARGNPTHSFNLGVDAMTLPELSFVLDRLLETKSHPLRFVIVDINPIRRRLTKGYDANSLRSIYWHDWQHTQLVWKSILQHAGDADQTPMDTLQLLSVHGALMCRVYSNCGRGANFLEPREKPKKRKRPVAPGVDGRGYFPVDEQMPEATAAAYAQDLAALSQPGAQTTTVDPLLNEELDRLAHSIERAGARPFFVIAPSLSPRRTVGPDHLETLVFDDPARYPQLYTAQHRYDPQHLNAEGAAIFTTLLADQIADRITAPSR